MLRYNYCDSVIDARSYKLENNLSLRGRHLSTRLQIQNQRPFCSLCCRTE